ncbi:hypothetical protein GCM10010440_71970 [Kitasatospora cinereorecta]
MRGVLAEFRGGVHAAADVGERVDVEFGFSLPDPVVFGRAALVAPLWIR